jgi:hypothetical protein
MNVEELITPPKLGTSTESETMTSSLSKPILCAQLTPHAMLAARISTPEFASYGTSAMADLRVLMLFKMPVSR